MKKENKTKEKRREKRKWRNKEGTNRERMKKRKKEKNEEKRKKNKNVMPKRYIQQSLHFWFRKLKKKKLQSFNYSEKKKTDWR